MIFAAEETLISLQTAIGIVSPIVLAVVGGGIILYRAYIAAKDEIIADKKAVIAGLEKEKALLQEKADRALAEKEAERKEEEALKKIFAEVGAEALRSAYDSRNEKRRQEGKTLLTIPVPVVAEGQSPPTAKQLEAARAQTMRAALAAIKLDAGQEPRKEPGHPEDFNDNSVKEPPKQSDAIRAVLETQAATSIADDKAKHATDLAVKLAKAEAAESKDAK